MTQRPGLANLSISGATAEQPCLEGLSCPALSGDDLAWKAEQDACWDQAKISVEVTPHVRTFCASHALVWFDCGYQISLDDCEHVYGMWKDAVLDRLARCEMSKICDDFVACEDGIFANL